MAHAAPRKDRELKPIEAEFVPKGTVRGGILILRSQDALDMVRRCREQGIRVLGLDGFKVTATITQPVMEQSIDLGSIAGSDAWSKAESFLAERGGSDLYFEVVTDR